MYETKTRIARLDLETQEGRSELEEIINDPLCSIISKEEDRRQEVEIDGEFQRRREDVHTVVTYTEKVLL